MLRKPRVEYEGATATVLVCTAALETSVDLPAPQPIEGCYFSRPWEIQFASFQ
jgi:superfamily II helicase